jgi:hypothetical protein
MHYDIKTAIRVRSQNFQIQYLKQFSITEGTMYSEGKYINEIILAVELRKKYGDNQGCGSGFNRVGGSGSGPGFGIRIRIQEGKKGPQK